MYDALLLQDDANLIDLPPESLWACLLSAAGLPASMCLRSEAGVTTAAVGQAADGSLTRQETINTNTSGGGGLLPAQSNVGSASTNDSGIFKTATIQDSVAGSSTLVISGLVVQPMSWLQALVVIQLAYKARFRHVSIAGQSAHPSLTIPCDKPKNFCDAISSPHGKCRRKLIVSSEIRSGQQYMPQQYMPPNTPTREGSKAGEWNLSRLLSRSRT